MDDFYRNLIWSLPDIVYQIDADGRFVYLNDSIRKIGYSPDELRGLHFGTIVEPRSDETINRTAYLSKMLETKSAGEKNFFNERRTGKRITKRLPVLLKCRQESTSSPAEFKEGVVYATGLYEPQSRGGAFIGTVGVIREFDDTALTATSLARIERYYRLLVEYSSELIAIIAHDGSVLYLSKSSIRNLGYEPFDLIGENITELIHPEDVNLLKKTFIGNSNFSEELYDLELRIRTADGRWKFFNSSFLPIFDTDGKNVMCYVQHCNDISRRKDIEMALMKREKLYKTLLYTSPDAIALFDSVGDIMMINERGAVLLGGSRYDLIGTSYSTLIVDEESKAINTMIRSMIEQGIYNDFQFTLCTLDGRRLPAEASFSCLKDDEGSLEGFLSVFRDITLRRETEEQRKRLEEELLSIIIGRLSEREIELLQIIFRGYHWPEQKREMGKMMDALPGTLDQFVTRIKKKMGMNDIEKIASISARYFNWK
ncbi:MAG: PAS domain-containing protein [Spirochaetes bacterium]|nr:PAS domain-containing protein [Spirochaetota bacterium]